METATLNIPPMPRLPITLLAPEDERTGRETVPSEIKSLQRLMRMLLVNDTQLRLLLSAMGDLRVDPPKVTLIPREISKGQFSRWMSGTEGMARKWLAAAVVLIEFLGMLRKQEAVAILSSDASPARKKIADMTSQTIKHLSGDLRSLEERPDLQEFLPIFRKALHLRLKADAHLSQADRERYDLWRSAFGNPD